MKLDPLLNMLVFAPPAENTPPAELLDWVKPFLRYAGEIDRGSPGKNTALMLGECGTELGLLLVDAIKFKRVSPHIPALVERVQRYRVEVGAMELLAIYSRGRVRSQRWLCGCTSSSPRRGAR